ncbi:hypothetical protein HN51_048915, partial [Arachis hypogaea]
MPQIISKVVNHTVHEVKSSSNNCTNIIKNLQNTLNTIEKRALDDCLKLFDDTIVELNTTILDLSKNPSSSSSSSSNQDLLHFLHILKVLYVAILFWLSTWTRSYTFLSQTGTSSWATLR